MKKKKASKNKGTIMAVLVNAIIKIYMHQSSHHNSLRHPNLQIQKDRKLSSTILIVNQYNHKKDPNKNPFQET